ncbi:DUF397 domain-containing protein [Spirillospora sp. CA-128828]|uniref:DUF397 domain-containing protein n=1 Tax=Spirillospora sp. CA-128828 TaxID=3240033 RepID=UPI003D908B1B
MRLIDGHSRMSGYSRSEMNNEEWYRSSFSGGNGGNCVERQRGRGPVKIRDSKAPVRGTLQFSHQAWGPFVKSL